jgi:hypothetical protein
MLELAQPLLKHTAIPFHNSLRYSRIILCGEGYLHPEPQAAAK